MHTTEAPGPTSRGGPFRGLTLGSIVSQAQFLSNEPGQSWRERTQTSFLGTDLFNIYQQGTYQPQV